MEPIMENILGSRIGESREKLGMTQDQFGARYGVSGPAVFKFEKGYVKPSLDLWLKMARDCEIPEKKAVLMWIKAKLPREYQSYVDLSSVSVSEPAAAYGAAAAERPNYARIGEQRELRQRLAADTALPAGMRAMFSDEEFWALYHPSGQEVQLLIERFGSYADAKEPLFRDAIRLVRSFIRSEY